MASTLQEIREFRVRRAGRERTIVPVILDEGHRARVAAVALSCEPSLGARFEFGGLVWEITHAKDHTRGWVAHPVTDRRVAC